jgi:hypothetical protein
MDPREATTPAGEGRLPLPPGLDEIVASHMELADKLATFSASSSLLKVYSPTVKSLKLSSSTWQSSPATAAGVQHLLRRGKLTSLVIYESREDAAMLRGLAACMEAGATEPGGYLSFLEHLEVTFPTDRRGALAGLSRASSDSLTEGLTRGLAVLEEALAATILRDGLAHLQALRFRPPTYKFHGGAQQRLVDALAAGKCRMLQTIDIHAPDAAMFVMCEARRAFQTCQGLKKLPFWLQELMRERLISEARMQVGRAIIRRLLASSLEEFMIRDRDHVEMGCFEAVNSTPSLRHLELRGGHANASVINQLVAGKAPNLTSLLIVRSYPPPDPHNPALERLCEAMEQGHFKGLRQLFIRVETDDQLRQLGAALAAPRAEGMADLESLRLFGVPGQEATRAALMPLLGLLRAGGCRSLRKLELDWFADGDSVMEALAEVWAADSPAAAASGRSLRALHVHDGPGIGDGSLVALARLLEEGGLPGLEVLDFGVKRFDRISTAGFTRLAAALAIAPAAQSLKELYFFRQRGPGPEELQPGYDALGRLLLDGGLPQLTRWDENIICSPALMEANRQELQLRNRRCAPFTY